MAFRSLRTNSWMMLTVLCLGLFMALLDAIIVNIALPTIGTGLDASLDEILWVVNAYLLVYAALLITAGRLGDIAGPKRLFLAGMALFSIATREIEPRLAGAAARVMETIQELGGVVAGAVVEALLQHRLAAALHEQALRRAGELPAEFRAQFLDTFASAASGGLQLGAGGNAAGAALPAEAQQLAAEVFRHGFVDAMHLVPLLPIGVVLLAALGRLAVRQEKPRREPAPVGAARVVEAQAGAGSQNRS